MKIKPISVYRPIKQSFKENPIKQYEDYDTYNKDITIKDAFISVGIVTGLCAIGTTLIANEDKIKKIIKKGIKIKKSLKTFKTLPLR